MTSTDLRPLLAYLSVVIGVCGLDLRLFEASSYPVTVAPFATAILLLSSRVWRVGPLPTVAAAVLISYPFVTALGMTIAQRGVDLEFGKMVASSALFIANGCCLIAAGAMRFAIPVTTYRRALAHSGALVVAFATVQVLALNVFGSDLLYAPFGEFSAQEPSEIDRWFEGVVYRGVGPYYEPSFLGKTLVSLGGAALILREKRTGVFLLLAGPALALSPGAAMMAAAILAVALLDNRLTRFGGGAMALVCASVGVIAVVLIFADRFAEVSAGAAASGNIRLRLPLIILEESLVEAPFGQVVGSNAALFLTYYNKLLIDEGRITNGAYELILYTGYVGIAGYIFLGLTVLACIIRRNVNLAIVAVTLLFGPVVSSSWLSFEGNFPTILVLTAFAACRPGGVSDQAVHRHRVPQQPGWAPRDGRLGEHSSRPA